MRNTHALSYQTCLGINPIDRLYHAATFAFDEQYGTQTGSPLGGTSTQTGTGNNNWSNSNDPTVTYSTNPITAGNNSFTKFQYGHFTGSYNSISAGLWAHTLTSFGTGLTLKGTVTTTYATPSATTNAALTTDMTSVISIGSGLAVLFTPTSPQTASPTSSITANPGFTQYLASQLQTIGSAAAGDTANVTLTLQYNEN
jgi:hypothetical protein